MYCNIAQQFTKIKINHPEIRNDFINGCFLLKVTKIPISRLPVGLTLEQTTNADAASQRTGIGVIKNSVSACQAWAESYYLR